MPNENATIQPINDLSQNDNNESVAPAESTSRFIDIIKEDCEKIYKSLFVETRLYNPQRTIHFIKQMYINNSEKQLLYYTLSNYFFSLNYDQHGIFISNIENLITYLEKEKNNLIRVDGEQCYEKIFRFSLKMYDHSNLASKQWIEFNHKSSNVASFIQAEINKAVTEKEKEIENKFKSLEKDSITILGIFVAIILAFIGSIVFPIELIENVSKVSIARLILLFTGISFIFINMLYLLIKFIIIINDKEKYLDKLSHICVINYSLLFIFILSLIITFLTDNIVALQLSVLENISSYLDNQTK